jgi:hypothetical protein
MTIGLPCSAPVVHDCSPPSFITAGRMGAPSLNRNETTFWIQHHAKAWQDMIDAEAGSRAPLDRTPYASIAIPSPRSHAIPLP